MALLHIEFGSSTLDMNQSVYVCLPGGFNDSDPLENNHRKFRTLYLFHGYNGNASDWTRFSSIERYAETHHVAVVMPSAFNSYYTNMQSGGRYLDFLADELPRYLKSILPLSSNPQNTYIAGLSMGGYGALKIGLTYPERFSFIGSMSGALDIEWIVDLNKDYEPRKKQFISTFGTEPLKNSIHDLFYLAKNAKTLPFIYINCGTEDFLLSSNEKFVHFLKKESIDHLYETFPGTHDWAYWDAQIQNVLKQIQLKALHL